MNEGRIVESQGLAGGGPPSGRPGGTLGVATLVGRRLGPGDDPDDIGILSVDRLSLGFLLVSVD